MTPSILLTITYSLLVVCARAGEKPNIVWIMAEDMGIDLECYGMAGVKTPNLNRLAAEGARFTRAYCSNPICSPSRSSMMTGVDQTVINAQHHRSNRDVPLAAPFKPITSHLRDAGYTAIIGSDLVMKKGRKIDCNFKYEETGSYDGVKNFGLFDKVDNFTAADQPFFNQIQCVVTHRGDWWIDVRKNSKHPVALHDVVLPPWIADTAETRYDWAAYLDTVEYMDDEVGQIMRKIKAEGLEKNTIVIFIGDNGRCNLRGKGYLQDTGIHVPMIVWAPGRVQAGTVVEEIIGMTDISATILKLAGAEMPDYLDGKPVFAVENPEYRSYIRSSRDIWDEIDECSRSITTKDFSYIKNHMPEVPMDAHQAYLDLNRPALWVMRKLKAEGKLTAAEMTYFADRKPVEELYDLKKDPDQMHNLANDPEYAPQLEKLRAMEMEWSSTHNDHGLADLSNRYPEKALSAERVRSWVKKNEPKLWQRLTDGELMETQSWTGKMKRSSK
ncbi:MAG: sulfatase family protein [Luteolibacter sp.]